MKFPYVVLRVVWLVRLTSLIRSVSDIPLVSMIKDTDGPSMTLLGKPKITLLVDLQSNLQFFFISNLTKLCQFVSHIGSHKIGQINILTLFKSCKKIRQYERKSLLSFLFFLSFFFFWCIIYSTFRLSNWNCCSCKSKIAQSWINFT